MATANLTDMSLLATDTTFQNRVAMSLYVFCWNTVPSESISSSSLAQHNARKQLAAAVLNNPSLYTSKFVNAVAANQTVANDATASGTLVGMTTQQLATAAAASFNAFISNI